MSMPKQGSSLASDGEIVHIALACLNWALSHIRRPICPPTSKLSNSMPVFTISHDDYIYINMYVCIYVCIRDEETTTWPSYQWMVTLF